MAKDTIRLSAHNTAGQSCAINGVACYASPEAVAAAIKVKLGLPTK